VVELTLRVLPSPELPDELPDLFACTDGDTAVFDLTENAGAIYGDQSPDDYRLTYHESEEDAEEGTAAIGQPGSYAYSGPEEGTIWVRLEDKETGCYSVGSFTIGVGAAMDIETPDPLVSCDDTAGEPDDGIGLFDLTVAIAQITGGNASYEVIFYASQEALENDDPIVEPEHYENETNGQTLPVVVISSEGCRAETSLTLVVVPNPQLPGELDPLEECDADNDGFAEFDLQAEVEGLLNGQPDVEITFHLTEAGAENKTQTIDPSGPYENSSPHEQTIWVRAENTGPEGSNGTGCYIIRPVELIVLPSQEIDHLGARYVST